jgi:hypothetical protein
MAIFASYISAVSVNSSTGIMTLLLSSELFPVPHSPFILAWTVCSEILTTLLNKLPKDYITTYMFM